MAETASGLYAGTVMHHRLRPRTHRLRYRLFSLLLDLDEIDGLSQRLTLFSRNRFNLFSFFDCDYGAGTDEPLRAQVENHMRAGGLALDGGAIRLLTMPRILGYVFNPISVYFCYRRDGALATVLYEVNNTFGERHGYLISVADPAAAPIRQECQKRLHVSPFLDMAMTYAFRIVPPGQRLSISIAGRSAEGLMIVTALSAERIALTDRALARAFLTYPLLTLKVIAGIHWEALWIWIKGGRVHRKPSPPAGPITIVHPFGS